MSGEQDRRRIKLTPARLSEMERQPKIAEAIRLLNGVGLPMEALKPLRRVRVALALLAAANVKSDTDWSDAVVADDQPPWVLTQKGFLRFWNDHYNTSYSMGSYDDVLREDLAYLLIAQLVVPNRPPGSHDPTGGYSIARDAADVVRGFGTDPEWDRKAREFADKHGGQLSVRLERPRRTRTVPPTFTNSFSPSYSTGEHGRLIKAVVEDFLPRHAKGAEVVLFEDSHYKHRPGERLKELGLTNLGTGKLPDLIAFDAERGLLFIIETVYTTNPVTKLRHLDLERITQGAEYPRVYISVFKSREDLREHLLNISWETEVWLADEPDHILHFDGDKYIVPYTQPDDPAADEQREG